MTADQRAALRIVIDIAVDSVNHSDYGDTTTEAQERSAVALLEDAFLAGAIA